MSSQSDVLSSLAGVPSGLKAPITWRDLDNDLQWDLVESLVLQVF